MGKKTSDKSEKETWLTPEVRKKWQDDLEKDREDALDELAEEIASKDVKYLQNLHAGVKRKHEDGSEGESDEEDDIGELERAAIVRIGTEKSNEKQVKGLLPIKTKSGVKQRVEEVDEDD